MYCVIPFIFGVSLDKSQLPLPFPCLHSLLEDFILPYYYSTASSALDSFLNHARQLRNSSVQLVPATVVKKILVVAKGADYKYDNSEVSLFGWGYLFLHFVCLLVSIPPFISSFLHLLPVFYQPTWMSTQPQSLFATLSSSSFSPSSPLHQLFKMILQSGQGKSSLANSFRNSPPAAIVHRSCDFVCPPQQALATSLLVAKGELKKKNLSYNAKSWSFS